MKPTLPKNLDPKLWQTRDGREVLELFHYPKNCDDERIIAHINDHDGNVSFYSYPENGVYLIEDESDSDLIPKPQKVGGWFNFYARKDGGIYIGDLNGYSSEKEAKRMTSNHSEYVATKYIEFEVYK